MSNIAIERPCPHCDKIQTVTVPHESYRAWQFGMKIQDAMPTVSADDREILITGICPTCWDELFKEI